MTYSCQSSWHCKHSHTLTYTHTHTHNTHTHTYTHTHTQTHTHTHMFTHTHIHTHTHTRTQTRIGKCSDSRAHMCVLLLFVAPTVGKMSILKPDANLFVYPIIKFSGNSSDSNPAHLLVQIFVPIIGTPIKHYASWIRKLEMNSSGSMYDHDPPRDPGSPFAIEA